MRVTLFVAGLLICLASPLSASGETVRAKLVKLTLKAKDAARAVVQFDATVATTVARACQRAGEGIARALIVKRGIVLPKPGPHPNVDFTFFDPRNNPVSGRITGVRLFKVVPTDTRAAAGTPNQRDPLVEVHYAYHAVTCQPSRSGGAEWSWAAGKD